MTPKYEFTGETKKFNGITLRRIRRLSDGLVGGWIESEANLSHKGKCFVYGDAQVYGNARVSDSAWVSGNARVYGNAQVYDDARASDSAWVYGNAQVYDDAQVYGNARVFGDTRIDRPFPTTEEFIGWKKVRGAILKLQILGTRSGSWGVKCRTNHCLVLEAFPLDAGSQETTFGSLYDLKFTYTVGKRAMSWTYNPDTTVEYGAGIHFFCSRVEAENY